MEVVIDFNEDEGQMEQQEEEAKDVKINLLIWSQLPHMSP